MLTTIFAMLMSFFRAVRNKDWNLHLSLRRQGWLAYRYRLVDITSINWQDFRYLTAMYFWNMTYQYARLCICARSLLMLVISLSRRHSLLIDKSSMFGKFWSNTSSLTTSFTQRLSRPMTYSTTSQWLFELIGTSYLFDKEETRCKRKGNLNAQVFGTGKCL